MDMIIAETTKTCNNINCNNKAVMRVKLYGYLCKHCYEKVRGGIPMKYLIKSFAYRPGKLFVGVTSSTKH